MEAIRTDVRVDPDKSRVLIRQFFPFPPEQSLHVVARVLSLSEQEVTRQLREVLEGFAARHFNIEDVFIRRYERIQGWKFTDQKLSRERSMLLGAYFTSEYSLECAALFNPSLIPHPDQSGLPEGSTRFIMSLRSVGEGHVSSIQFREGTISADHRIEIEKPCQFVTARDPLPTTPYEKEQFGLKLFDLNLENDYSQKVMSRLGSFFTLEELRRAINEVGEREPKMDGENQFTRDNMTYLALSNYEVEFGEEIPMSARVIFPYSPSETNGIEDPRFVRFKNDDGSFTYYASYTAYNGRAIFPQLLQTDDFRRFRIRTMSGREIRDKDFALFPQKIGGRYVMLSRQDGENIFIMHSDRVDTWREKAPLVRPTYPWEFIKVGACGSPILTEEGWLCIDHGVGPMRRYCIGAFLLDRDDPTKLIGRLEEPLLEPHEQERAGYVPNVVYSCGSMVHNGVLVLPYAMSDYASRIALVEMEELLAALTPQ